MLGLGLWGPAGGSQSLHLGFSDENHPWNGTVPGNPDVDPASNDGRAFKLLGMKWRDWPDVLTTTELTMFTEWGF